MTESVSEALERLRKRAELSMAKLARASGYKNGSSIQKYLDGTFKKKYLPLEVAESFADGLEGRGRPPITRDEVIRLAGINVGEVRHGEYIEITRPKTQTGEAPIPILGAAVAGESGDFRFSGETIDYATRPPGIAHTKDVYVLYVRGHSMSPWREENQKVYVDPHRPARPGDYVVVVMQPVQAGEPGAAYIKRLVSRSASKIRLFQYKPEKEFDIPADKVERLHRIFTLEELLS